MKVDDSYDRGTIMSPDDTVRDKLRGLYYIATFQPKLTALIIVFGVTTALLEGIGITFIVPLVEVAQSPGSPPEGGLVGAFAAVYQFFGISFTLGSIVVGLSLIISVRYLMSFLFQWAQAFLRVNYVRDLQSRSFENSLDTRIIYFDAEGSDDMLNAIVTQAQKAGFAIEAFVRVFLSSMLIAMYLGVALYLTPLLTVVAISLIGGSTLFLRKIVESNFAIGDRVAEANEGIQRAVQSGTQGIREVKMLGYDTKLFQEFQDAVWKYTDASIKGKRNEAVIQNGQNLVIAVLIFVLIYASVVYTNMSFGELGAFLFVMFKLGPTVSGLNSRFYQLEGMLPHLLRTEAFIDDLQRNREIESGEKPVPADTLPLVFEDVHFAYGEHEKVLDGISFSVEQEEFVAFVGESGAGKSTIASLIARLYDHDDGEIFAAGTPIQDYDLTEWRSRVAYVRQDPHIFNTTLKKNLLVANSNASRADIERVSEIAQVTEFLDDLPNGYDTELGEDGVRLSGGQLQRVALARALLEDADILVLDEATSDLDTNIENRVQQEIEAMDNDFTIVAIAHRLSTVNGADRIYTLEDGKIIEQGAHDTLLQKEGRYAELYSAQ